MSLAENPVFLLLFFLLLLCLLQITLESSLKIERHMIVRGEDIQRWNMVVVFVAGTMSRFSVRTKRSCYLFISAAITNGIANIGILKEIIKRKRIF